MVRDLAIDDNLLCEVLEIGGFKTKKEAVDSALEEFVSR